tara:strand:- start:20017 stop:20298 length:282 start_codon:yes stop_codon:yes gene_type:complete
MKIKDITDGCEGASKPSYEDLEIIVGILEDRLEEIRMALGADLPESNTYDKRTIEYGIFELRRKVYLQEKMGEKFEDYYKQYMVEMYGKGLAE